MSSFNSPIQKRLTRFLEREFGVVLKTGQSLGSLVRWKDVYPEMNRYMWYMNKHGETTAGYHGHLSRYRSNCTQIGMMEVLRYRKDFVRMLLL